MLLLVNTAFLLATGAFAEEKWWPSSGGGDDDSGGTECAEESVRAECICSSSSWTKGAQCSGCKDPMFWGYGCDIPCHPSCGAAGCDFVGECRANNCKANKRMSGSSGHIVNSFGHCSACIRGYYGLMCRDKCEEIIGNHCKPTTEGPCTRTGTCYECQEGWYGETCNTPCPGECKNCVMKDNMVLMEESGKGDQYYPAGACLEQCSGDVFGMNCDQQCPANCKKTTIPSCDKYTGDCMKCGGKPGNGPDAKHQFWGPTCATECAKGCVDSMCYKSNGECEVGVHIGWCGRMGDKQCPKHTIGGCDIDTCFPHKCAHGRFPGYTDDGKPTCIGCSDNCLHNTCDKKGVCTEGCKKGWYGPKCERQCSSRCAADPGSCDQDTGVCHGCHDGMTGGFCTDVCHPTCETCQQFDNSIIGSMKGPGTGSNHCMSCHATQPTALESATCKCITASKPDPGDHGICKCEGTDNPSKQTIFLNDNRGKRCSSRCQDGYKEVFADMASDCLSQDVWRAIFIADNLEQGSCAEGEKFIPKVDTCVKAGYVSYILD